MNNLFRAGALLLIVISVLCASAQEVKTPEPASKTQQSAQQQSPQPDADGKAPQSTTPPQPEAHPKKKKKAARGALVVAPLPISSPAIGSGIVPVIGYIFPFSTKDKISPPSTVGAAGLVTNNGSRGFAIGGQLFLKQNTYE